MSRSVRAPSVMPTHQFRASQATEYTGPTQRQALGPVPPPAGHNPRCGAAVVLHQYTSFTPFVWNEELEEQAFHAGPPWLEGQSVFTSVAVFHAELDRFLQFWGGLARSRFR